MCLVGWLVATGLGVTVVYGIYTVTKPGGTSFNKAENVTYGTFSRFVWGLALAWVIYACQKGYGSKWIQFIETILYLGVEKSVEFTLLLNSVICYKTERDNLSTYEEQREAVSRAQTVFFLNSDWFISAGLGENLNVRLIGSFSFIHIGTCVDGSCRIS